MIGRRSFLSMFMGSALLAGVVIATAGPATADPAACPQNLIVNCGFETGDLTGWTPDGLGLGYGAGAISGNAFDGRYAWLGSADGTGASITQTVTGLLAGETCSLDYYTEHNARGATNDDAFTAQVTWDNATSRASNTDSDLPPRGYQRGAISFLLTSNTSVTATFTASGTDGSQFLLDNVTLTCGPSLVWTAPSTITYGTDLSTILTAQSSVAGSTTYTVASGPGSTTGETVTPSTILTPGTYTLLASFSAAGSLTHSLTVTPAPLTITASSPTVPYGSPIVIAPQYSGFVNQDTESVLSSTPTCVAAAPSVPHPGSYATSCSGAAADNYAISYQGGVLDVTKAPTTLTSAVRRTLIFTTFSASLARSFDQVRIVGQTVSFAEHGFTRCSAVTDSTGIATCTAIGLSLGVHSYTARYLGSPDYLAATTTAPL